MTRIRITLKPTGDPAEDLRRAARVRLDLWAHSPVEVEPDSPVHGTHRDADQRAYFEFVTEYPDEVDRVLRDHGHVDDVIVDREPPPLGEACENCGNVAGPVLPTVCPNCAFRDISPCPQCGAEVPRRGYVHDGGDLFRCPRCGGCVRLRFNSPMFLPDGSYNQPLVVVESAVLQHESR